MCSDALGLYAVADGMGGHLGGERASRMAVEILERHITTEHAAWLDNSQPSEGPIDPNEPSSQHALALRRAVGEADRAIYDSALADPAFLGMGTTLTAILFQDRRAHIGHVGDSRAYIYRDGKFRQITEDHSWIQDQVRAGILSPAEARESKFRNIITRSVGFEPAVHPDMQDLILQAGYCFVICSDGLSNHLSTEDIGQVLTTQFYRDVPETLIAMANQLGGDDNITCVCVHISND